MSVLLLILNPRRIPEALWAYEQLEVPRVWLTGFYESQLGPEITQVIDSTDFDHYLISSDDLHVTQDALDAVTGLLEEGEPVVTGWCGLDETDPHANICHKPLRGDTGPRGYDFYKITDVQAWPTARLPTWFLGMCLTGMTRDLWREFPFQALPQQVHSGDVYPHPAGGKGMFDKGFGSDWYLSRRLTDAGHGPFVAARDGYCQHLKTKWNEVDWRDTHRILNGTIPAETRYDLEPAKAAA